MNGIFYGAVLVRGRHLFLKTLKYILIGVLIFISIVVIEFCCLYAVLGDNIWNYLKDFWEWYKTLLI